MNEKQRGPVDDPPWPTELTGRVTMRGESPRVHGYDLQKDVAANYRLAEVWLLYLTGQVPDEKTGRAFEIALTFFSSVDAGEAPAHAAMIARMCDATTSGIVSVAATGLSERHRALLLSHRDLVAWLDHKLPIFPEQNRQKKSASVEPIKNLVALLPNTFASHAIFSETPTLASAILAILHACGLTRSETIEAALTLATLACTCAEAFAMKPSDFKNYPMTTPAFVYEKK